MNSKSEEDGLRCGKLEKEDAQEGMVSVSDDALTNGI